MSIVLIVNSLSLRIQIVQIGKNTFNRQLMMHSIRLHNSQSKLSMQCIEYSIQLKLICISWQSCLLSYILSLLFKVLQNVSVYHLLQVYFPTDFHSNNKSRRSNMKLAICYLSNEEIQIAAFTKQLVGCQGEHT